MPAGSTGSWQGRGPWARVALAVSGFVVFSALGPMATLNGPAQTSKAGEHMRRGHMTLHWRDETKTTNLGMTQGEEGGTVTKTLDANVVFEVSDEQLSFFDPDYIRAIAGANPVGHVYTFLNNPAMNQPPSFGGPLGGRLVSFSGTGTYTRDHHIDSGNYHETDSAEGSGPLGALMAGFAVDQFTGLAAGSQGFLVTVSATGFDGRRTTSQTYQDHESVNTDVTLDQGKPHDPRWTVSVTHPPKSYVYGVTAHYQQSSTIPGDSDIEENGTLNFTFDLSGDIDVEAVIIPERGYEHWIPDAGKDEDTPGNDLRVTVVLQKKDRPKEAPGRTAKFRFELEDVSKEPGTCLNWPPKEQAKTTPDLKIDKDNQDLAEYAADGQSATTKKGLLMSYVKISSYDYGAYGKLKVIATLDKDGREIQAHLKDTPDKEILTIPLDENDNHIADPWEKDEAPPSLAADSDDDGYPKGNGDNGDDLSLYEEYRGFMVNGGEHVRTHPNFKDVFVWDPDSMTTGYFTASGFDLYTVEEGEFSYDVDSGTMNPLVLNFNHGFAHLGNKPVLWLHDANLPGLLGLADCYAGGQRVPGLPKTCKWIEVDLTKCVNPPSGSLELLQETIAHELAHGTNVWHHGDTDYHVDNIYDRAKSGRSIQHPGKWTVAVSGGQESGVQECIMKYEGASVYESEGGPWSWWHGLHIVSGESYPPPESPGTIFCDSSTGTGVNDPKGGTLPDGRKLPKAGNATKGDCVHQFSVNDLKH